MPSFTLIHPTVWPQYTNVTDRQAGQDRQTGQRSDSIGRTVLQTVAQKLVFGRTSTAADFHLLFKVDVWCATEVAERLQQYYHVSLYCYTQRDSDVISSYHIYASCFSAMMWGKLCETFVIVTSYIFSKIVVIQTFS